MVRIILSLLLVLSLPAFAQEPNSEDKIYKEEDFKPAVKLQALNKITARVSSIEAKVGKKSKFGNIEISLLKCWKAPPEESPENKALLRVWEQVPGEEKKEIFSGWMFESSPALSALEHPVYDISILECFTPEETS